MAICPLIRSVLVFCISWGEGLRKLVPVGGTANYPYILKAHEPLKYLLDGHLQLVAVLRY